MNKKNRILFQLPLFCLIFSFLLGTASIVAAIADELTINANNRFVSSDGNYYCYQIEGAGNETSVAIAWAKEPAETPDSLTVPETITFNEVPYTVKAIAEGGFRFCDFKAINLPDTIVEIKEEAFYSCQNMTKFYLPPNITKIAPSTFMDCRSMDHFFYKYRGGEDDNRNSLVTEIGDHAFNSCVSLVSFSCPTTLASIGEAAFQNCAKLPRFFFPRTSDSANVSIGRYAFSDCKAMSYGQFETNVKTVGEFAFAECDRLTLHYTGNSIPSGGGFDLNWRKKHVATNKTNATNDYVPIETKNGSYDVLVKTYPGLYYTVETNKAINLDQRQSGTGTLQIASSSTYVQIIGFDTPDQDYPGYYEGGHLTIPDKIGDYYVKVIASNAFSYNEDLTGVTFNKNLVQICNKAFYNCPNIGAYNDVLEMDDTLDFSLCEKLFEISYEVFQDTSSPANTKLKSLTLAPSLKIVGYRSFYNFREVDEFSFGSGSEIGVIGQYAFAYLGYNKGENGTVDLELSSWLNDQDSTDPYGYKKLKPKTANSASTGDNAVSDYAFYNANCLRTVTMPSAIKNGKNPRSSFGTHVFELCQSLLRFVSNSKLGYLGASCFHRCINIREIFLDSSTTKGISSSYVPWGSSGTVFAGPIFGSATNHEKINDTYQDAVIYIKSTSGNLHVTNQEGGAGKNWNVDSSRTFLNEYSTNTYAMILGRERIPTYYNVGWSSSNMKIKYLNLNTGVLSSEMDFSAPVLALLPSGSNYIPTRCYSKTNIAEIDLTSNSTINNKIKEIGDCCFANMQDKATLGTTFIFPSSLTTIGERAFYRQNTYTSNNNGVGIFTYKNNGSIVKIAGKPETGYNYCALPSSVTTVKRLAFYNNKFNYISLSSKLASLGQMAFTSFPDTAWKSGKWANSRASVQEMSFDSASTKFKVVNNGIYYYEMVNDVETPKVLVYQAQKCPVDDQGKAISSVQIAEGTLAAGARCAVNTNYTKISIPESMTTIYGGAFALNINLTEFEIPQSSSLKYIAATAPSEEEVYSSTMPFDIEGISRQMTADYNSYASSFGAFYACQKLTTLDFTRLTNLKKIGYGAFQLCALLSNMTGGASYHYYTWKGSGSWNEETSGWNTSPIEESAVNQTTGVLDLQNCTQLTSIGRYAFGECEALDYIHLPNSDSLYLGTDSDLTTDAQNSTLSPFNKTSSTILVGQNYSIARYDSASEANRKRYPKESLNVSGCTTYYRTDTIDDVNTTSDQTELKYWAKLPSGTNRYILLTNRAKAEAYYGLTQAQRNAL